MLEAVAAAPILALLVAILSHRASPLISGLNSVDVGAHQSFSIPPSYGASLVTTGAAPLPGVFSL